MRRLALLAVPCLVTGQTPTADPMKDLISAKDWPGLEAWAKTQITANPKEARYQLALGASLANQARPAEAVAAFRRATELNPDKAEAWYNLCLAGA